MGLTNSTATKVANARHKQKVARFNATQTRKLASTKPAQRAQGAAMRKPAQRGNPQPKLKKLPIKIGLCGVALLGYPHNIWHMQSNMYINTVLQIRAYALHTLPNGYIWFYVPAKGSKPAYHIKAHSNPATFTAGIQQFYIIKWLK